MRSRATIIGLAFAVVLAARAADAAGLGQAQADAAPACIEVEVDGQRIPAYDCLAEKLKPNAAAQAPRPDAALASERIAQRPANEVALFNQAATHQRMGNAFGESVHPQRPPAPPPAAPRVGR